jgi:hypothetical protein
MLGAGGKSAHLFDSDGTYTFLQHVIPAEAHVFNSFENIHDAYYMRFSSKDTIVGAISVDLVSCVSATD